MTGRRFFFRANSQAKAKSWVFGIIATERRGSLMEDPIAGVGVWPHAFTLRYVEIDTNLSTGDPEVPSDLHR